MTFFRDACWFKALSTLSSILVRFTWKAGQKAGTR